MAVMEVNGVVESIDYYSSQSVTRELEPGPELTDLVRTTRD